MKHVDVVRKRHRAGTQGLMLGVHNSQSTPAALRRKQLPDIRPLFSYVPSNKKKKNDSLRKSKKELGLPSCGSKEPGKMNVKA